ncbi:MAG: lysophospholipid acyltransferase family protein [Candidatus Izemoplasmatales bacterium]
MILLLQLFFALAMTVYYVVKSAVVLNFLGVLSILGVFIASAVAFMIVLVILFAITIFVTEKSDKKSMFKHGLLNVFARYVFLDLFRVKLVVTGKENLPTNRLFVVISNHIEYTDPIYLKVVFHKFPLSFVAKEPLFKVFLIKQILAGSGNIPISKNADRSAMKSIVESIKAVKDGQPMGIFPEGMRTYKNELIDFKPGAFKLAQKPGADIIPVCLYNMHGVLKKGRIKRHTAYIHIFPKIPYSEYQDLDTIDVAEKVKAIILEKQNEFKKTIKEDC